MFEAAQDGRVAEVSSLMRDNPDLNVNWQDKKCHWTALHRASLNGHAEIVKVLLAHPRISVNKENVYGQTPVLEGCFGGCVSVELLLKDPRVDVALADEDRCTPLWCASYCGHFEVVKWLIASGRDLGDVNMVGEYVGKECTALEMARG